MKDNFPNVVKEIDFQEAQRISKNLDPRRNTPRHIIITLAKMKGKERILKAAREKETVTYKGVPIRLSTDFSKNLAGKEGLERSISSHERQGPTSKRTLPAKLSYTMGGQIKCFPEKVKLKEFIITKPLLYEMLKGLT